MHNKASNAKTQLEPFHFLKSTASYNIRKLIDELYEEPYITGLPSFKEQFKSID